MTPEDLSEEVRETLNALREVGLKLSIGSSSRNAKFILERLGLGDFFDAVSDGTNITRSKPDPEVFLKAASFLNLHPSECMVVEDARAGVLAAVNGGFDCAAIGDAFDHEQAKYRLTSFRDLTDVLNIEA